MSIAQQLKFTSAQLEQFAVILQNARLAAGLTQLEVARRAYRYEISHCKVSRIERAVMKEVDAHAIELFARVVGVPHSMLLEVDPLFKEKAAVSRVATKLGLWNRSAKVVHTGHDVVGSLRTYCPVMREA